MVLAPSLPIQCKQIHEAHFVWSPVQIKSTGMRKGGGLAWSTQPVLKNSSALKSLFCNKIFAPSLILGSLGAGVLGVPPATCN